jgi:hypothetical protein
MTLPLSRPSMRRQQKQLLIFGLGLVTIWDTFTTITGTLDLIGNGKMQLIVAIIFGLLISAFLLGTMPLLNNPREELIIMGGKLLWFLALLYDLYTSYMGHFTFVQNTRGYGAGQIAVIAGMTLFVSSSPIIISYLLNEVDSI